MPLHWKALAATALLAGAGSAVIWLTLERSRRRAVAGRLAAQERRIADLEAAIEAFGAHLAELNPRAGQDSPPLSSIEAAAEGAASTQLESARPEMLAAITAAATAFLGKPARVRSARPVPALQEAVSPWSQQGRVTVQTSHNLRARE